MIIPLFLLASLLAWFSWTRIARTKVFHLPVYNPPLPAVILSLLLIFVFIYMGLTAFRTHPVSAVPTPSPVQKAPVPALLMIAGALWATFLYGIVLLAFGIMPDFPPIIALLAGILLSWIPLYFLPRWTSGQSWQNKHRFALIFGVATGAMLAGFIGFLDTTGPDLYFKIIVNVIAVVLLILLGFKADKISV